MVTINCHPSIYIFMVALMGKLNETDDVCIFFIIYISFSTFSRRIMWLHVSSTNHNPVVILHYYLTCVEKIGGNEHVLYHTLHNITA